MHKNSSSFSSPYGATIPTGITRSQAHREWGEATGSCERCDDDVTYLPQRMKHDNGEEHALLCSECSAADFSFEDEIIALAFKLLNRKP